MLGNSLQEEKDTDLRLSELAETLVNPEAMEAEGKGISEQKLALR